MLRLPRRSRPTLGGSLRLGALVLGLASAVGCGEVTAQRPAAEASAQAPQGLSLQKDPARPNALSGTFREGNRTLFIEVLRGQPTSEEVRQNPSAPHFEMDLRLTDA